MALLDEIKAMQSQGMTDDQIIQIMRQRGLKYKDIADSLSQTKIKSAVEGPAEEPGNYQGNQDTAAMQASMMNQQAPAPGQQIEEVPQPQQYVPSPNQEYATYPNYDQQSYQQPTVSSEVITEISEQVITEKLGELRKYLEKIIDFKTSIESKVDLLDERVKRIEKTIDILQSSVLRKVGDYITNVQDIKNELIETQRTFSKLAGSQREVRKQEKPKI